LICRIHSILEAQAIVTLGVEIETN
jgi:hypothetical protein